MEMLLSETKFDYCINCAAYTAVDKAETEKDLAYDINAWAVGKLAALCRKYQTRLLHISTDYVFDGKKMDGYSEEDATSPLNVYGASKLEGERLAMQNDPATVIIRTSWVYSSYGKNFVKTMLRLMKEKESIGVVNDQFGCPTYAADLAACIFTIIEKKDPPAGIYHYCNEGVISWFEFANEIRNLCGFDCTVNPINSSSYPVAAKRPQYSILHTHKIREVFNPAIPAWQHSLIKCIGLIEK